MDGLPIRAWAGAALAALLSTAAAAAELPMHEDGWYSWEVPAGQGADGACCYRFHRGEVSQVGCRLGEGAGRTWCSANNLPAADTIRIFVERRTGRVQGIHAFSSACPVETSSPARELPSVTSEQSIEWLLQRAAEDTAVLDDALMAVSLHADPAAVEALSSVLEDRDRAMKAREQALFWLVQSDSDAAYAYLERLLDPGAAPVR